MKCITVRQPHAHLLATGAKFVDNRTWETNYRGWLAIHAGKSENALSDGDMERYPDMAFSAIVAVTHMAGCVHINHIARLIETQPEFGWIRDQNHIIGPFCWLLPVIYPLAEPVQRVGKRGLFSLPLSTVRRLRAAAKTFPFRAAG